MAASAFRWSVASEAAEAVKTRLPLESSVLTSVKPAASNAFFRSGILAFVGMMPRRKAA
jgi:hypothetical protein